MVKMSDAFIVTGNTVVCKTQLVAANYIFLSFQSVLRFSNASPVNESVDNLIIHC